MATVFNGGTSCSREAAASLSGKQYYAVKLDTNSKIALCDTAGESIFGILQDEPAAGKQGVVQTSGFSRAVAGGTFNPGTLLKVTTAGKLDTASAAVTATNDGGSATDPLIGSYVVARALDAGADGRIIGVEIIHMGAVPTTAA